MTNKETGFQVLKTENISDVGNVSEANATTHPELLMREAPLRNISQCSGIIIYGWIDHTEFHYCKDEARLPFHGVNDRGHPRRVAKFRSRSRYSPSEEWQSEIWRWNKKTGVDVNGKKNEIFVSDPELYHSNKFTVTYFLLSLASDIRAIIFHTVIARLPECISEKWWKNYSASCL